jgi:thiol-disulfide isomerase/thioredoxin
MRHPLQLLTAILLLSSAPACAPAPRPASTASAAPGVLPAARVVHVDGQETDLPSVVRGRVALVSFWATWCEACDGEMAALSRLEQRAQARQDALVVTVAVGETRDAAVEFARRRGLAGVQLVDEDFRLADALGQRQVPATLVVDRQGRIVYRGGALDAAGLAAFRGALDEPQAQPALLTSSER